MSRIRVLQLVSGIAIGEQSGGAEQVALQVALHLNREEFKPAIFVMHRYDSSAEAIWQQRLVEAGIPIYGFEKVSDPNRTNSLRVWQSLWQCVTAFQPDVINSHSERGDALNALIHLLNPRHPAAVRTMHTDQQWQTRPWVGKFLLQGVFPLVFADEIAVSQTVRAVMDRRPLARLLHRRATLCYAAIDLTPFRRRRQTNVSSILPIPNPPDYSRCNNEESLPPGIPSERPRVGIIGRLAPQKGHATLFQAIAQIVKQRSVHLLVVGTGELEAELRHLAASLGIASWVHFLGSRRDVAEILPHLDLLVSASLWEGLPGVILEALAAEVPVVATDVSGSREVVIHGETGLLVPAGRPDALAETILQALEQPKLMQSMAQRGSQSVERFSIEQMVAEYATVYRKVATSRGNNYKKLHRTTL